jgi:hypothetical protein
LKDNKILFRENGETFYLIEENFKKMCEFIEKFEGYYLLNLDDLILIDDKEKKKIYFFKLKENKEPLKTEKKLEEEIKEAIKKSKEVKQKTVSEKYYFAGQEFEEKKEISEKEVEKIKKKRTNKELDAIINEIAKKRNISTMDKSKKDWKNYVEKNNIEKELMNNRKDGFLGKKKFIDETNEIVTEQNKVSIKKAKYAYENKVNGK